MESEHFGFVKMKLNILVGEETKQFFVSVGKDTRLYMGVYTHIHICIHVSAEMCIHIFICIYVCVYVCLQVCLSACVHIHRYGGMHAYIHTYSRLPGSASSISTQPTVCKMKLRRSQLKGTDKDF